MILFLLGVILFVIHTGCGEEKTGQDNADQQESIFDQFSFAEIINLDLSTNVDSLLLNKEEEVDQPASLSFADASGQPVHFDLEVSARGVTRKGYCTIPPIKLKFPKPVLTEAGLAGFKTLKLVIPCRDSATYEDLVMKEYLCYKLYQLITDQSFRVQLAKINLVNSTNQTTVMEKYGFIIEHEDEMARHLNGKILDDAVDQIKSVDKETYNLLTVFQYMIGNTDWNLSLRHNIKLVDCPQNSSPIPVPYDFDFSGIVNAPYAKPHPNLPIKNVTDRFFQWRGKDPEQLNQCIEEFRDKKEDILDKVYNFKWQNEASKRDMLGYLDAFYGEIESEDAVEILLNSQSID
jgi:hypothetical protein